MSLKTICFLSLLIVSCTFAKSINNLKNKFLSKTSAQIPTKAVLAQVTSLLKQERPACIPDDSPTPPPTGNTPPVGCIWVFMHCTAEQSIAANGKFEICRNVPDVGALSLTSMTNFQSIFGTTWAGNISGVQVGPGGYVTFWENTNYGGQSVVVTNNSFQSLCALGWNDKPRSFKLLPEDNQGTSVSTIEATGTVPNGCVWLYLHCSAADSRNAGPAGVIQWCGLNTKFDLSTLTFYNPNIAFNPTAGPVFNNGNMANNLSGIKLPTTLKATLYNYNLSELIVLGTQTPNPNFFCNNNISNVNNDQIKYIKLENL